MGMAVDILKATKSYNDRAHKMPKEDKVKELSVPHVQVTQRSVVPTQHGVQLWCSGRRRVVRDVIAQLHPH